jgi:hypothetical protein
VGNSNGRDGDIPKPCRQLACRIFGA